VAKATEDLNESIKSYPLDEPIATAQRIVPKTTKTEDRVKHFKEHQRKSESTSNAPKQQGRSEVNTSPQPKT
jgi:hypothetical protein